MSDLGSEIYWKRQNEIPGSTRVPTFEIRQYFYPNDPSVILDIGAGSGRSTDELKRVFPSSKIIALDISSGGIRQIDPNTAHRIEATAMHLPFRDGSVDCVNLCGVMTNITDKNPFKAQQAREDLGMEINRVLVKGGLCTISDFHNKHLLSHYPINYEHHLKITGELGTIAVFDPAAKITFIDKSDEEIKSLANSEHLQRLAHHYSPEELINIFNESGMKTLNYHIEIGKTPSGTPIDSIVMTIEKPNA